MHILLQINNFFNLLLDSKINDTYCIPKEREVLNPSKYNQIFTQVRNLDVELRLES